MFIGHYAPAFVAATHRKSPRLGAVFIAAQLVDIAFFSFLLIGVEKMRLEPHATAMNPMDLYHMPWTHSLIGALAWSVLFALVVRLMRGSWAGAWIGAAVVTSHWLLDLLVHRPDLTLIGSGQRYGFGLWNYPAIEIPLELALAFGALAFFAWRTQAKGAAGRWSLVALAVAMAAFQAINWFGAQPDSVVDTVPSSVGLLALFAYGVLALLAWWVARSREMRA